MKRLLNKILKKDPKLRYVIPEYQPLDNLPHNEELKLTKSDSEESSNLDEKKIKEIINLLSENQVK